MDMKLNWDKIYWREQEDIEKILKSLYDSKNWQELHVALWAWLSFNGGREKHEWFDKFNVPEVKHYCFACEQAEISFYFPPTKSTPDDDRVATNFCHYCPITNSSAEECLNGLYGKWLTTYLEEREEIATEIASLEWTVK